MITGNRNRDFKIFRSSSSSNIFFNIDGLKATRLSGHSKIDGVLPLSTFARVTCMHHQMNELTEGEKWRAHVFCV